MIIKLNIFVVTSGVPKNKELFSGVFGVDQAKALAKMGHQVVVLAVDLRSIRHKRKYGYSSCSMNGINVELINFPCGRIPLHIRCLLGKLFFKYLFKIAREKYGKPDILHSHFTVVSYMCSKVAVNNKIPFIITEHSSIIGKGIASEYEMKLARKAYARATRLLSVSNSLAKSIKMINGRPAMVVPNVLDSVFIESFKQEYTRSDAVFNYVSCGSLIKGKGFDVLIKAFAKISKTNSMLTIIGTGIEEKPLKNLVSELDLDNRISFEGFCTREKMREIYAKSDCFVLSSCYETFGVVYIEALACGLPIIATRCGGPEDFVTTENGILVDVNDIDGLSDAMKMINENQSKYDKSYIRNNCISLYSPDAVSKQLTFIYETVLYAVDQNIRKI